MGRRLKLLDPEREARFLDALRAGNYRKQACAFAGIGDTTLYRWLDQATTDEQQNKQTIYRAFRDKVIEAEAEAEVEAVSHLRKAMPNDWRAAEAYLKAKHPERWATHRDLTKIAERRLALAERTAERIALAAEDALTVLKLDAAQRALFVQSFQAALGRFEGPQEIEGSFEELAA